MAVNIEILDNYEKNGKTYTGSFPMFISTVVCEVDSEENLQQDQLLLIQEEDV